MMKCNEQGGLSSYKLNQQQFPFFKLKKHTFYFQMFYVHIFHAALDLQVIFFSFLFFLN